MRIAKHTVSAFIFAGLAGLSCADAFGAEAPPVSRNATRQETREVLVSATRTERELFDVPSSAAIVGAKQMEREPRGTIAEQLQDIPGVQVADGGMGGGAKRISIRGESPARVLVLIDGIKISEQKSMDGSMIMIDPSNVERIEVIKGPASVLYGSEAIGGVVNIITKKGGDKPIQGTFAATWDGSNNSITPVATLYGSFNGFNYRVSGDYTDAGDKRGGSGVIDDTGYTENNWSAYLDYTWDKGKVGAGYDHFWSNISIPGMAQPPMSIDMHLPEWKRERFYAFAELNDISDVLRKVSLTGAYQETHKEFWNDINVSVAPLTPMFPLTYMKTNQHPFTENDQKSYSANLQTDWTFGDSHYVIAGIDYLYDDLDAKDHRQSRTETRTPKRVMTPFPHFEFPIKVTTTDERYKYEAHQQTIAFFAQDEWTLHDDWKATLGVRYTMLESSLDSTDDSTLEEGTDTDSHLVGSAGLVYSGLDDWRFRALYAQGYRYPLLNQMYIGTTHGSSGRANPNPDLKPETSQNFELGARYDANGFAADFAVYYNASEDYITNSSIPGTNDTRFENIAEADTYGSELTLSYTFEPWSLTPYVTGAYMYRTYDRKGEAGETALTGDPRWTGRTGIKFEKDLTPVLTIHGDIYGRFASGAKEESAAGIVTHEAGWGTAGIAIGARMGEEKNYFVDLNLNNLLDRSYKTALNSLEEPGFNAVLRFGFDF